jgi:hypothetical protein
MLDRIVKGMDKRSAQRDHASCPMCGGSQFVNFHQQVLDILDTHYEPRGAARTAAAGGDAPLRHAGGSVRGSRERLAAPGAGMSTRASRERLHSPIVGSPVTQSLSALCAVAPAEEDEAGSCVPMTRRGSGMQTSEGGRTAQRHGSAALEEAVANAEAQRLTQSLRTHRQSVDAGGAVAVALPAGVRCSMEEAAANASRLSGCTAASTGVWRGSVPDPHLLTGHTAALLSMTADEHARLITCSADKSIKVRGCCVASAA